MRTVSLIFVQLAVVIVAMLVWSPDADAAENVGSVSHIDRLASDLEQYRDLLQTGLSIHEIDRELERIAVREAEVGERISVTEKRLAEDELLVQEHRVRAGKVIRSYYSGERINLLMIFFRLNRFADAWAVLEYIQIIFQNDREILNRYVESYQQLQASYEELTRIETELQEVRELYRSRRSELVRMQSELDEKLKQIPEQEAEQIMDEIRMLTEQWEEVGLPLFQHYFEALADAMNELPTMLSEHSDMLSSRGLNWTFRLNDERLNDFLRQQDDMFHHLTFRFEDEQMTAEGEYEGTTLSITGRYYIEDEPEHHIGFELQELRFRDVELPASTLSELDETFDLGFYPSSFVPFVVADKVETKEGELIVHLRLALR